MCWSSRRSAGARRRYERRPKLVDQLAHDYSTNTMLTVYRSRSSSGHFAQRSRCPTDAQILEDVKPYDLARPSPVGHGQHVSRLSKRGAYAF